MDAAAGLTWSKICGITRSADTATAERAGANAIGFNFYPPSPRYIDPEAAGAIAALTGCTRVGLFVDPSEDDVRAACDACALDLLQFHGDETPEFCERFAMPYMKVIRMRDDTDIDAVVARFSDAWAIMLDTYVPGVPGGTGAAFDWGRWPQGLEARLVLAGGLDPENVSAAITALQPFGVDVSSGVEGQRKGIKDPARVEAFMKEVRRVGSAAG